MVTQNEALGSIPAFSIAFINWLYSIFILNRFVGICGFSKVELLALPLFLVGGYAAWISELCIMHDHLYSLQIISSLFRTLVNWIGFILIVNERLAVSRQQFGSLLFILTMTVLWDVQHKIVIVTNDTCP